MLLKRLILKVKSRLAPPIPNMKNEITYIKKRKRDRESNYRKKALLFLSSDTGSIIISDHHLRCCISALTFFVEYFYINDPTYPYMYMFSQGL